MKKIFDIGNLNEELKKAEKEYKYQPELTEKLDGLDGDFTDKTISKIFLWKVNRYPHFKEETLTRLNDLKRNYSIEKAKLILKDILNLRGFDLPMASTILRFLLPNEFQIIDQRVYRLIMKDEDKLKMSSVVDKKVELYFNYLKNLKRICKTYNISFVNSDRVLYQLDKIHNKNHKLR